MKNKTMNKVLSLLLTAAMMLGIFAAPPITAYAAGIWTTAGLSPELAGRAADPTDPNSSPQVSSPILSNSTTAWFGGYQWVIIGWDGAGVASAPDTATLLLHNDSPSKPSSARYDEDNVTGNVYESSDLRTTMNTTFYNTITDARETNAIAPRSLTGGSANYSYSGSEITVTDFSAAAGSTDANTYIDGNYLQNTATFDWYAYDSLRRNGDIGGAAYTGDYRPDNIAGGSITDNNFWPLSVAEASLLDPSIRVYSDHWWLRSPGNSAYDAAVVFDFGHVNADGSYLNLTYAIRPAFQLDLSSVIFTSAAASGGGASPKSDATAGSGLVGASAPAAQILKFTILDTGIATPSIANTSGMNFDYSGAEIGADYFLSCVLVGTQGADDGVVKYYGKLADNTSNAAGNFTLPLTGVNDGTYTLKIFCEQANGDNETDFAGASEDMTLVVTSGSGQIVQPPSITAGPAGQSVTEGDTATFTVTATGDSLSYQWQVSTDNGSTWNDVTTGTGGNTASYTTPATTSAMNDWQYRVKVSNAAGDVESNAATLTVNTTPSTHGITLTADPTAGGNPSASVTSATDGTTITLAANPNTNYTFTHWEVTSPAALTLSDDSDPAATFTMPDEAVTITAHYSYYKPSGGGNAPPVIWRQAAKPPQHGHADPFRHSEEQPPDRDHHQGNGAGRAGQGGNRPGRRRAALQLYSRDAVHQPNRQHQRRRAGFTEIQRREICAGGNLHVPLAL